MPTNDEIQALNRVEDDISSALQRDENALFLARITCRATRELLYRIHDPKVANESLQQLISADSQLREWEYQMEKDESWQLAEPELSLLRKARLN